MDAHDDKVEPEVPLNLIQPAVEIWDVDVAVVMHTECQQLYKLQLLPINQIQHRLHLWEEMALCGKEMPQILVDVVYRISLNSHLVSPMLLVVTRWRKQLAVHDTEMKAIIGLCLFAGGHRSNCITLV